MERETAIGRTNVRAGKKYTIKWWRV